MKKRIIIGLTALLISVVVINIHGSTQPVAQGKVYTIPIAKEDNIVPAIPTEQPLSPVPDTSAQGGSPAPEPSPAAGTINTPNTPAPAPALTPTNTQNSSSTEDITQPGTHSQDITQLNITPAKQQ